MQIGVQNMTIVSRSYKRKKGFVSLHALQIQNKNLNEKGDKYKELSRVM